MEQRSALTQQFITAEIGRALDRAGLPVDHPIKDELDARAALVGIRDAGVRIVDGDRIAMLDDYIAELKTDPQYVGTFPPDPKTISVRNQRLVNANLQAIADGKVRVVD